MVDSQLLEYATCLFQGMSRLFGGWWIGDWHLLLKSVLKTAVHKPLLSVGQPYAVQMSHH